MNISSSFPLSFRNASFSTASILSLKKNLFYSLPIGIVHQILYNRHSLADSPRSIESTRWRPDLPLRLASSGCRSGNSCGLPKNGWRDQYRPCAASSFRSAPKCSKPGAPSNCYCNGITKYGQWWCGFGYEKACNFALWDLATSRQAGRH